MPQQGPAPATAPKSKQQHEEQSQQAQNAMEQLRQVPNAANAPAVMQGVQERKIDDGPPRLPIGCLPGLKSGEEASHVAIEKEKKEDCTAGGDVKTVQLCEKIEQLHEFAGLSATTNNKNKERVYQTQMMEIQDMFNTLKQLDRESYDSMMQQPKYRDFEHAYNPKGMNSTWHAFKEDSVENNDNVNRNDSCIVWETKKTVEDSQYKMALQASIESAKQEQQGRTFGGRPGPAPGPAPPPISESSLSIPDYLNDDVSSDGMTNGQS